jgi:serine/threonine protein kinase
MSTKLAKGQRFGDWELIKLLGEGGNGFVWRARNSRGDTGAIKILSKLEGNRKLKAYERFKGEVRIHREYQDLEGLLPILDSFLPEEIDELPPWYVMPVAQPLVKYLQGQSLEATVQAIMEIGKTLAQLHERGVSHRDIKPANLLVLDDRCYLGDFGLADFPDKPDLTRSDERIGAVWTIAPEMRRKGDKSNGAPADVYSLSKTLWILLTGIKEGFDGQYDPESVNGLKNIDLKRPIEYEMQYFGSIPSVYTKPLDDLLRACTNDDPSERPSMIEFVEELGSWIELLQDFKKRNPLQWRDIHLSFFPNVVPNQAVWTDLEAIVQVLDHLGSIHGLNHMLLPYGGGMDLKGARSGMEEGTIELIIDERIAYIVRPKRLMFENFRFDWEWNYFRLETGGLEPTGIVGPSRGREELVEIEPLEYIERGYWDEGEYCGQRLPPSARLVSRFMAGDFLILQKTSMYNWIGSTYDGRHNQMNADEFRDYIAKTIQFVQSAREDKQVQKSALENNIRVDDVVREGLSELYRQHSITKFQDSYLDPSAPKRMSS